MTTSFCSNRDTVAEGNASPHETNGKRGCYRLIHSIAVPAGEIFNCWTKFLSKT